jgi:phosphohistidine phosphatase
MYRTARLSAEVVRPHRGDNVPVKRLLILRHAKSDWGDSSLDDWERPLAGRGINDAPRVGEMLRQRSSLPDLIITSDAIRARSTAEAVAEAAGYTGEILLEPTLYLATPGAIVEVLNSIADDAGAVMIVGHNPGLEGLIAQLSGEHQPMPTAALVQLSLPIERWRDLDLSLSASIVDTWRPKD